MEKHIFSRTTLFYVAVFLLFFLLDRFGPFTTDDYRYLAIGGMSGGVDGVNMPVQSLKDIIVSQIYDYTHINGRFIVHCITTYFCCFVPMWAFRVINSLLFVVLVWSIDKLLKREGYSQSINKYLIAFGLFFLTPAPGEVLVGHIATCVNYLWVAVATTWYILLLYKTDSKAYRWYSQMLFFLLAAVIGSLQESFSVGLSGALFVYYCFNFDKFKRANKALVFGYWIGCCVLLVAPGNYARLSSAEGEGLFNGVAKVVISMGYLLTSSWTLPIMIAALAFLFFAERKLCRRTVRENARYLMAIAFSSIIVAVIYTGERQLTFTEMLSMIILIKVINDAAFFQSLNRKRLLLGVMALYAMAIYPFIYVARQEMCVASRALQNSEVKDGIIYHNGLVKCTNKWYRQGLIRRFIYPETIDLYGISLWMSNGSDCRLVKAILPCSKEELYAQFQANNDKGIYYNAEEKFCLAQTDTNTVECHLVSYSEASLLGKLRNVVFSGATMNVKHLTVSGSYFLYRGHKYFVVYDSYMKHYGYAFAK